MFKIDFYFGITELIQLPCFQANLKYHSEYIHSFKFQVVMAKTFKKVTTLKITKILIVNYHAHYTVVLHEMSFLNGL